MSTSPNGPQHYVTPEDVDAWLLAAQERRARLDQQAALAPWHSDERQEVFGRCPPCSRRRLRRCASSVNRRGSGVKASVAKRLSCGHTLPSSWNAVSR